MAIYHIIPNNDLEEHSNKGFLCPCQPAVKYFENGSVIVVHNAWDGRELFEPIIFNYPEIKN